MMTCDNLVTCDRRLYEDEEDELSEVEPTAVPTEVRDWLTQTFTRSLSNVRRRENERFHFKSVANAIRAGIVVERRALCIVHCTFM